MKTILTFVLAFLIIGFFFLALPEKGYSGLAFQLPGCCQFIDDFEGSECGIIDGALDISACNEFGGIPLSGETCNEETRFCSGFSPTTNVPTLSEWGLIAMAGVLGIIGFFMVIRRRKATA